MSEVSVSVLYVRYTRDIDDRVLAAWRLCRRAIMFTWKFNHRGVYCTMRSTYHVPPCCGTYERSSQLDGLRLKVGVVVEKERHERRTTALTGKVKGRLPSCMKRGADVEAERREMYH